MLITWDGGVQACKGLGYHDMTWITKLMDTERANVSSRPATKGCSCEDNSKKSSSQDDREMTKPWPKSALRMCGVTNYWRAMD